MRSPRECLIGLNLIPGVGSTRLRRLLDVCGSVERLWQASVSELRQVEGIGFELAQRIVAGMRDEQALNRELDVAQHSGVRLVTLKETAYPIWLKEIADPPLVLAVRGTLTTDEVGLAIVGSRRASLYGLQIAQRLGYDLALRGATIVSGLARGIDAAAHRGALKAKGRTIAVLGNGLSRIYPPEHATLAQEIVTGGGAVISEYPMGMAPLAQNFPRRNRVISGLARGVLIVEAALRSGALITADCALEQGREVFAVPGKVDSFTSQGTHQLLKQGAKLVATVEDVLEELHVGDWVPATRQSEACEPRPVSGLGGDEQAILKGLHEEHAMTIDVLSVGTGLPAATCAAVLLRLELKGHVVQRPGKQFIRRIAREHAAV